MNSTDRPSVPGGGGRGSDAHRGSNRLVIPPSGFEGHRLEVEILWGRKNGFVLSANGEYILCDSPTLRAYCSACLLCNQRPVPHAIALDVMESPSANISRDDPKVKLARKYKSLLNRREDLPAGFKIERWGPGAYRIKVDRVVIRGLKRVPECAVPLLGVNVELPDLEAACDACVGGRQAGPGAEES